ncbi:MAG: c-type cytochrome [Hylemonella sp.]
MSDNHQDEAHTGPIKTPSQLLWAAIAAFVIPVFIIIGLAKFVVLAPKPAAGTVNMEKSVSDRLQKVGAVEVRDANRPLKAGADVYNAQCVACHAAGVAGAPKFGDAGAWGARIKTGLDALVNSALKGKGAMAAQGGGDHSDVEIARAVVHMANAAGAKFEEPKAPAATAAAPAK